MLINFNFSYAQINIKWAFLSTVILINNLVSKNYDYNNGLMWNRTAWLVKNSS